jgi:hypothetical protein
MENSPHPFDAGEGWFATEKAELRRKHEAAGIQTPNSNFP